MPSQLDPLGSDALFFKSLISADVETLGKLISDDFVLVGVFDGSEVSKEMLLEALNTRLLEFVSIDPAERRLRMYHNAAVVNGRTSMVCRYAGAEARVDSRYTHVFVEDDGAWKLVSAQGTIIQQ